MLDRLLVRRAAAAPHHDPYAVLAGLRADAPDPGYTSDDRRREFRAVLRGDAAARRVCAQILARCRVCERAYVPGDPHETARREGMRDVGLWLLEILDERPVAAPAAAEDEPSAAGAEG